MPQHRIWAEVIPGHPPEPLDGCFVHSHSGRLGAQSARCFRYPSRARGLQRGGGSGTEAHGADARRRDRALLADPHRRQGGRPLLDCGRGGAARARLAHQAGSWSWELRPKLRAQSRRLPAPAPSSSSYGERKGLHGQEGGGPGVGADRRLPRAEERKPFSDPGLPDRGTCPGRLPGRPSAVAGGRHPGGSERAWARPRSRSWPSWSRPAAPACWKSCGEQIPPGLVEMLEISGLGVAKIRQIHEVLGIDSLPELEAAAHDGRLAKLPRFGPRTSENILKAIAFLRQASSFRLSASCRRRSRRT